MSTLKRCGYCLAYKPNNELYIAGKHIFGYDTACIDCLNNPARKANPPQPLMTVEQYLLSKQKSITRPIDQQFSTRTIQGTATINQQPCQVTLEEVTTLTRRVIINPSNQS
jgi:hypothetical protein